MNKKIITRVSVLLASLFVVTAFFTGCSTNNDDGSDQIYTIQYALDTGTETITVKDGELYSMESVPTKFGYTFKGLYDTEIGGTQFVNASGLSVSAFTDKKNMVLYPQWEAKTYTLILDYQGAAVTDVRSLEVSYDSQLPILPLGLSLENKNFKGWFTEPIRQGTQISDEYGVLPDKSVLNQSTFDIPTDGNRIYLYAGFQGQMYDVTLYFDDGNTFEEIQVEHGTYAKDIVCETRIGGKAVYSWTKVEGSEAPFTGKITGETVLYALEFAPVIDFDTNGGKILNPLVEKSGNAIVLPTPTKPNYVFSCWKDGSGNVVNYSTMPTDSVTLYAQWKPTITFDARGGTAVSTISQDVGQSVPLPTTTKDGYIFAGWYTESGEKYTSSSMPSVSIKLFAKWYKKHSFTVNFTKEGRTTSGSSLNAKCYLRYEYVLSDEDYQALRNAPYLEINITYDAKLQSDYVGRNSYYYQMGINFNGGTSVYYWSSEISDGTMHLDWKQDSISYAITNPSVDSNVLRYAVYANTEKWYSDHFFKNHQITISYTDITTLY